MKSKISLITLGVSDIKRSLTFYRDGLGLKTHNYKDGDNNVMFEMDGTWLGLYPADELAKDARVPSDGSGFNRFTLAHNVDSKQKVDDVFAFAVAAGAKPIKQPEDAFWGGYSGYFADPDGFLWEVAYNPFTDLS
jgi:catechol 2,3-dioxygenase-like lactoylglutathione lyase family enzyme